MAEFIIIMLFLLLIATGVTVDYMSPQRRRRRLLKKRAHADYEAARGTAHKKVLQKEKMRLQNQLANEEKNRQDLLQRRTGRAGKLQQDLRTQLARHLVETRLREVNGIGKVRQQRIIHFVFKGKLSDLRRARQVKGISDTMQFSINRWITHYEKQIPRLLKGPFPGKQAIVQRHEDELAAMQRQAQEIDGLIVLLKSHLERVNTELKWLDAVTSDDFLLAMQSRVGAPPIVARYISGVFPTHAAVPDWFQLIAARQLVPLPAGSGGGAGDATVESGSSGFWLELREGSAPVTPPAPVTPRAAPVPADRPVPSVPPDPPPPTGPADPAPTPTLARDAMVPAPRSVTDGAPESDASATRENGAAAAESASAAPDHTPAGFPTSKSRYRTRSLQSASDDAVSGKQEPVQEKSDSQQEAPLPVDASRIDTQFINGLALHQIAWLKSRAAKDMVNELLRRMDYSGTYDEMMHWTLWTNGTRTYRVYHRLPGHPDTERAIERLQ